MRDIYELILCVQSADDIGDPNHCEITIEPAVNGSNLSDFGDPDDHELLGAGLHHAATLGRLVADILPWLDYERVAHKCCEPYEPSLGWDLAPKWRDACHLTALGVADPTKAEAHQPRLWLYVPAKKQSEWLKRVRDSLTVIMAAT